MTTTAYPQDDIAQFAADVYDFLAALDPSAWRDDAVERARSTLAQLRAEAARLFDVLAALGPSQARLRDAVARLASALPEPGVLSDQRADWVRLRDTLAPLYADAALALRAHGARVELLRPTNLARSLVHASSGVIVMLAFEHVFSQPVAIALAVLWVTWAWSLEGLRRVSPLVNRACMAVFGPIAREHERHGINAGTWYGTAVLILTITACSYAGVLGILVLAFGDPAAGLFGRAFGRTRLPGGKSVEGALAFVVAGALASLAYLSLWHPEIPLSAAVTLALVAASVGSVVELLSTRIQDNFSIPVLSGWASVATAAWLAL